MTLSVQKRVPLPPAIIIEIPNSSPSHSEFESDEHLGNFKKSGINADMHCSPNQSSPYYQHHFTDISPKLPKNDHTKRRPGRCGSFLSPTAIPMQDGTHKYAHSLRGSQNSIGSHGLVVQYWTPFRVNQQPESQFLDLPKPSNSLRHSHSLRSTQSFGGRIEKVKDGCEEMNSPPTRCSGSAMSRQPSVVGDSLTPNYHPVPQLSRFSSGDVGHGCFMDPLLMRHGMVPSRIYQAASNCSSSDASSSQLSSQMCRNLMPSNNRMAHRQSFQDVGDSAPRERPRLCRSASLVERARSTDNSDTTGERVPRGRLSDPRATIDPNYYNSRTRPPRSARSWVFSPQTEHPLGQVQRSRVPVSFHLCNPDPSTDWSIPNNVNSILSQRRHTDGSDGRPGHLKPVIVTRRSNSVSSHRSRNRLDSVYVIPGIDGQRPRGSCVVCCQPPQTCNCLTAQEDTTAATWDDLFANQGTESSSQIILEASAKSPLLIPSVTSPDMSAQSQCRGICFCQLIVLLVIMQLTLGLFTAAMGFYLRWTIPILPTEECAFWAAIPITLSGLLGAYICLQRRLPRTDNRLSYAIWRIAGILSLLSCIVCLVASIFSGQKGSMIASYRDSCLKPPTHNDVQQALNESQIVDAPVKTLYQDQCCLDDTSFDGANVCQCYNMRHQLIWTYHSMTCRFLFSSVKDYLILQSALMAVGSGACLWFWVVLTEKEAARGRTLNMEEVQDKKQSISSARNCFSDNTTTTSLDGKRISVEIIDPLRPAMCAQERSSHSTVCEIEGLPRSKPSSTQLKDPAGLQKRITSLD